MDWIFPWIPTFPPVDFWAPPQSTIVSRASESELSETVVRRPWICMKKIVVWAFHRINDCGWAYQSWLQEKSMDPRLCPGHIFVNISKLWLEGRGFMDPNCGLGIWLLVATATLGGGMV